MVRFFQEQKKQKNPFLAAYFRLERELRLVLVALRAKEQKRDLEEELKYEDPFDLFVQFILAQKDMETFQPPKEYEEVKVIFEK